MAKTYRKRSWRSLLAKRDGRLEDTKTAVNLKTNKQNRPKERVELRKEYL